MNATTSLLETVSSKIETLIALLGRTIAWASVVIVVFSLLAVILRYLIGINTVLYQEIALYAHASLFMLGSAWAFLKQEHVRVDVFYSGFSELKKAWVNLLGTLLFLFPMMIFIISFSWNYVARSIRILEVSQEGEGLPLVYCLKALIPVSSSLMVLVGVAYVLRQLVIIMQTREGATHHG